VKLCLFALAAALVAAQSTTTTQYTTDINGHRVEEFTHQATDGVRTVRAQSINGRKVPLEQTEERVLSEGPSGKVTERIVRKYDSTGQLATTDRVLIDEKNLPGGGSHVEETTWRSDLNGNMYKNEQRTSDTRVSGDTTTVETAIARPAVNGGFETAEKHSSVIEGPPERQQTTETVSRRGGDGQFFDALREVRVTEKTGAETKESAVFYDAGINGKLEPSRQSVSTTSKRPDGSEVTEVNLYTRGGPARVEENGPPQQIREQQIIERRKAADGSVVETLSMRLPSVADPNKLGGLQKLSETVCTGKCP
jgi:hypothetical protein